MSATNYEAKYGELDGLLKKYCDKKKKESKSLHKQLEEEISTNVELRKYVALLESKLLSEKDNFAQLERLYRDAMDRVDEVTKERTRKLEDMASDASSRLLLVEQRERECAERVAALELREEQFWLSFNNFEAHRIEVEAGLAACKRTMEAELQHSREAIEVANDCLCDIKTKGEDITGRAQEVEYESHLLRHRTVLELEERALRDDITSFELETRSSLVGNFFNEHSSHLRLQLSEILHREKQLQNTTDLLHLHEVEFSSRVRKERDFFQDERSRAELMRSTYALECKNVLRGVSDLLDSISETDTESLRLDLEAKLQDMLQPPSRSVR